MLEPSLIKPIAETIAKALLDQFVEGDRVLWSVSGDFNDHRYPFREGTIVRLNRRKSGMAFPVVRFDDERRPDLLYQEVLPSSLKRL